MHILGLQLDIEWERAEKNIQQVSKLLEHREADIIVLPEMWNTGFSMNPKGIAENSDGQSVEAMKSWAKNKDALVLGSLPIVTDSGVYNRAYACFPDGKCSAYDKTHLFTYAGEDRSFNAGTQNNIIEYRGLRILPQVCYDLRFPESARCTPSDPYDILIYMANWPARRSYAWNQLLIARAIENQSYCLGVNRIGVDGNGHYYNGSSTAIDYSGKVLCRASHLNSDIRLHVDLNQLNMFRARFPFLKDQKSL